MEWLGVWVNEGMKGIVMDKALLEARVHDGLRLADRMMRDSWGTGDAASWQPARGALAEFLRYEFAQIEAAERERCAQLCEAHAGSRSTGAWAILMAAAGRIRDA